MGRPIQSRRYHHVQNLFSSGQLDSNVDPSIPRPCRRAAPVIANACEDEVRKYIVCQASESLLCPHPLLPLDRSLFFVALHGPRHFASRWTNQSAPDFRWQFKRMSR